MSRSSQYRLAIRAEGSTIGAWFAEVGTMTGAKLLATMSRDVAERWPDSFEAFKTAASVMFVHMQQLVEGGSVQAMQERPAPPSEIRAGQDTGSAS
ncbi:hypothetical protein [Variovorax sp. RCC_210]|uniref:hypothetical protein n=1 Tax=Variovorax sp. RCC_210 TaxID=3239217 RepID=UPI003524458F